MNLNLRLFYLHYLVVVPVSIPIRDLMNLNPLQYGIEDAALLFQSLLGI